jgi:uncharacterized membrane protein
MTRTVIGLFRDSNEAQAALQDLEGAGFTREHLNLVAFDGSGTYSDLAKRSSELGSNTTKGAAAGGMAGLLIGLAAVAIPGIGPVVAAGPIAAALAGAGVGAATGGMLGALNDMGVPGNEAKYYQEAIRRGGTMLVVQAGGDTSAEQAQSILDRHGAIDIDEQSAGWRAEGWNPDESHSDATNYGEEGGSSQWSHTALTASAKRRGSRVYPDRRNSG